MGWWKEFLKLISTPHSTFRFRAEDMLYGTPIRELADIEEHFELVEKPGVDYNTLEHIYGEEIVKKADSFKIEVYRDADKQWRWRMKSKNGKIVAEGGEGYKRKPTMLKTLNKIKEVFDLVEIKELD